MTHQPFGPSNASSSAFGHDVIVAGWAGISVSVTWALLARGVRVRPSVLRDARDHVLYHLDARMAVMHAEDRATWLTHQFVSRARRREPEDLWPQDAAMLLSPRWRRALDRSLTPLTEVVFRQHYGDGRSIEALEKALQVDRIAIEGARGGLREVIRAAAHLDGVPLDQWSTARLDRLLVRLAAFSPQPCPPFERVFKGEDKEHQAGCARCDRAVRLLRAEIIAPEDLLPPPGARPEHRARVLALHFHPDGRHHRARLLKEADVPAFPVGDDMLLLDWSRPDEVTALLVLAAEVGLPPRDHLRGAVLEGPGRWSRHGLLGPLVERAREAVRPRPWGVVQTVGDLPAPLPEPPSARRWWGATAALAVCAAWSLGAVLHPAPPDRDHPIDVTFTQGRGGIWTAFDVPEGALVTLVREVDGQLDVVSRGGSASEKSSFAVGDGGYRVHAMGTGVLVVSSAERLDDLEPFLAAAAKAPKPLHDLAERLRASHPRADMHVHRR